ncbi:hypothetical protein ACFVZH_03425 [Streptomyces sp. NPDC059534]|uniref:hypothetical protein n=1 Tax=Streptomyces sp. NPDC059534 TaxID=3346859 RepID=UPI0036B36C01
MIRHLARTSAVLTAAVLSLAACGGGGTTSTGTPAHPVFSEPLARQVNLALRHTQETGGADFRQTVTFGAGKDTAVQNLTGRLDFAGSRGEAASRWSLTPGFPEDARETILGTLPGHATGDAAGRYTVDTRAIHYRADSAGYWLRYEGDIEPLWGIDSISHLRGTEGAIGGTLLEVLSAARPTAQPTTADGGRSYRTDFPLGAALDLFPYDLRTEFVSGPLHVTDPSPPVPVTVDVDREGRIVRARADLSSLLSHEPDSLLAGVTTLRADLTLGRFGAPEPAVSATPDGRVLDAAGAVRPSYEVAAGACMDFNTGMRHSRLVTRVPCAGPHDGKVTGQHPLPGAYPGSEAARDRAGRACARAEGPGTPWYTWSTEDEWTDRGAGRATCYTVSTRRSAA